MTEGLLVALIVVLHVGHVVVARMERAERAKLLNAVLARNPAEFVALERTAPASKPRDDGDDTERRGGPVPVGLE